MNEDERIVLNMLGMAWDRFLTLDEVHPADRNEFMFLIHQAQNMVLARGTLRALSNAGRDDPRATWIKEGA